MKHYDVPQWVDFARGVMQGLDVEAMRSHLAGGCSDCGETAQFYETLNQVCRTMVSNPAPDWAVRNAKAIFPANLRHSRPSFRAVRIPVELIYDSLLAPLPAGLRSSWQTGWQALYQAGECSLDLRVEPEISSGRTAVIGQISNHVKPENTMENTPIILKSGKLPIAETRSNRFGEFQLEYEQQGRLHLHVYLEDGAKCFQVPLKKLASDKPWEERLGLVSGPSKRRPDSH
jgi:hypothetical protein